LVLREVRAVWSAYLAWKMMTPRLVLVEIDGLVDALIQVEHAEHPRRCRPVSKA
jgi:hypothetical protein